MVSARPSIRKKSSKIINEIQQKLTARSAFLCTLVFHQEEAVTLKQLINQLLRLLRKLIQISINAAFDPEQGIVLLVLKKDIYPEVMVCHNQLLADLQQISHRQLGQASQDKFL